MFPRARFINIVRDGRFVVTSMQEKFGWSFHRSMITWRSSVTAGNEIKAQRPNDFLQIRYEAVVTEPEPVLRTLFKFIGEDFYHGSLEFMRIPINTAPGREHETPSEKLDSKRLNWDISKTARFRLVCGSLQKIMAYPFS